MEITLVRHGRPDFSGGRIPVGELIRGLRRYDAAGIRPDPPPPDDLRSMASRADIVLASDRRRAIESAESLGRAAQLLIDPLFREVPLPHLLPAPAGLRLSYGTWVVTARVMWLAGWVRGSESLGAARRRADQACEMLIERGNGTHHVMLVAHNVINMLIGRELRRRGWRGPALAAGRYWASYAYRLPVGGLEA